MSFDLKVQPWAEWPNDLTNYHRVRENNNSYVLIPKFPIRLNPNGCLILQAILLSII